jgi:predicted nucleic acid-binding protein
MSDPLLLDTDILVKVARGDLTAISHLNQLMSNNGIHISAVTEMELIVGCRNKSELRELTRLLKQITIIPITPEITASAVKLLHSYRLSHGLLIADALIAATAIVSGRTLSSGNAKHFMMIKELSFRLS